MQITSAKDNSLSDIIIHSIGVSRATTTFMLFCFHCGREQDQITGKLTRIIPWLEPSNTMVVIKRCDRCRTNYTLQETATTTKVVVRLGRQELSPFYCAVCHFDFPNLSTQTCPRCNTIYDFK